MESIIVVSDVHWSERSNFEEFNEFLDGVANLTPTYLTEIVQNHQLKKDQR